MGRWIGNNYRYSLTELEGLAIDYKNLTASNHVCDLPDKSVRINKHSYSNLARILAAIV